MKLFINSLFYYFKSVISGRDVTMFLGGVVVFSESKMDGSFHGGSKVAEEPRVDFLWHHNASILIRTEAECGVSASFNA